LSVCLDSWVVLAWLDAEQPAQARIEGFLETRPTISWINAVEVYYRLERDHGRTQADQVLAELRIALTLDLPSTTRMVEAARLKAQLPIALADCFAIATALAHDLTLLTGDPEILDREVPCRVEDLRSR
jgi:predicted nucleic acid-binding protein